MISSFYFRSVVSIVFLQTNSFALQANEDGNCYSYDARKLDEAKCVHKDHVSAV